MSVIHQCQTKNWHQQTDTLLRYQATCAHPHLRCAKTWKPAPVSPTQIQRRRSDASHYSSRSSRAVSTPLRVSSVSSGPLGGPSDSQELRWPEGQSSHDDLAAIRWFRSVPAHRRRVLVGDKGRHYGSSRASSTRRFSHCSPTKIYIAAGRNGFFGLILTLVHLDVTCIREAGHLIVVAVVTSLRARPAPSRRSFAPAAATSVLPTGLGSSQENARDRQP